MFWQECKEVGAFLSMSDWLTAMAALQSGSASDHLCLLADTIVLAESITKLLRFHLIYHVTLNINLIYFASSWITKWENLEYNAGLHGYCSSQKVNKVHLAFCWLSDAAFKEHLAAKLNLCAPKRLSFLFSSQILCARLTLCSSMASIHCCRCSGSCALRYHTLSFTLMSRRHSSNSWG